VCSTHFLYRALGTVTFLVNFFVSIPRIEPSPCESELTPKSERHHVFILLVRLYYCKIRRVRCVVSTGGRRDDARHTCRKKDTPSRKATYIEGDLILNYSISYGGLDDAWRTCQKKPTAAEKNHVPYKERDLILTYVYHITCKGDA
jgi:hypothetical protein